MSRPRIIIYAEPDDMSLAARVAVTIGKPDYVWPKDGVTFINFYNPATEKEWEGKRFGVRRNKLGFTIYGPSNPEGAA